MEGLQPGGPAASAGASDGGPLGPEGDVGVGPGRRRGARGALQYAGGAVDGIADLPATVPGREQVVPGPVRGDLPMGPQSDRSYAVGSSGRVIQGRSR